MTETSYDGRTALVVVDVQNDFADRDGSLYVRGGEQIVPVINDEIRAALAERALVVYTQDWHPERTPHFDTDGGTWPRHCVQDTPGAQLHPDLLVDGPVVRKGTDGGDGYSGFSVRDPVSGDVDRTQLEGILRDRGVQRLVVAGLAQDVCVKETALDGLRLGFEVEVLTAATRPVDLQPGDGQRALDEMTGAGAKLR